MERADEWDRPFAIGADRLTPLTAGPARLATLIALIEGAERSLRLLYYIFADDESGRRVRDALVAAARRGVSVSLIIDGFGSPLSDAFLQPLTDSGVDLCRFIPRFGRRYLLRNHQKMTLADEARALIGGFNVEDGYFNGQWRDLGLLVEGPAAGRLAPWFDTLVAWTHDPKAKVRTLRRALVRHSEWHRGAPLRWLFGGPTRGPSPWAQVMRVDIANARRLDVIAAYFAPNPGNLRRIERVVRRNRGEARIITAALSDNNATIGAARHTYRRLLRRGVRVAEYQPARLHTKLYVVDDRVHIGSANFDMRSLYLNLELMLRVEDAAFAAHLRRWAEAEWAESREVTNADHDKVGPLLRLRWSLAYFVVAILDYRLTRRLNFGFE
ncbi:phospholipase D-like domain-containing protein [Sphingomonas quercus]|uniref:Phospholipase D n=1 Tax=Sphingomonas quercus TaxID=2842451 RepID=A0ABS6BG13_9SPHN|nr:phosphatidylserine/phosphatidylglycerophosphate/cardiolipin synthase family protein [Sphingomonas quercus]MBU3077228.1 phosphatidylserine/phosphatidylglycerophosphate/cardiolipin synthase family protein [Sphingomonas quercus]